MSDQFISGIEKLEYIEKSNYKEGNPDIIVIWLHGLGADYNDFATLVNDLKLDKKVKFILPNAPIRPITINGGYKMRGWYDIRNLSDKNDIDSFGIMKSAAQIEYLCDSLVNNGINSDKIILGGFSQGGVISYCAGLLSKYKFAGIIALSCYLPNTILTDDVLLSKKSVPILACHGTQDFVVPYEFGLHAYQYLSKKIENIQWCNYDMGHSVCVAEMLDISRFINSVS